MLMTLKPTFIVQWRMHGIYILDSYRASTVLIDGWLPTDWSSTETKQNLYGLAQRGDFFKCNQIHCLSQELQWSHRTSWEIWECMLMASFPWQITSKSFRDHVSSSWGNCGRYEDPCLKKPPDSYCMLSLSAGWSIVTLCSLDFRPNPSGIYRWSKMFSGVCGSMTMSLPQWRLNSTGCVFRSESVLNWVLWFTKLFAEKVLRIWGNCAFRWATFSICPATGLQTEEICSFRELTRRHMAGEPSARLALLPGTVSQLRFVNRRPWQFLSRNSKPFCSLSRTL